jgi:hypothetical protein
LSQCGAAGRGQSWAQMSFAKIRRRGLSPHSTA